MHEKFGIIDGRHAYNGSANIDINANLKYTENRFFFYDNPEMVTALQGEFDRLWEMGQWLYNPDEKPGKDAHVENK
jgi:phosphatidylserine/phosphatidylglycerophosphate/cardiolipin synthase-like enzyme